MEGRVLLVEGLDDQHVMWALFKSHQVPETFKVEQVQGIENLLESIPVRLKASNMERFAVVIDADEDIGQRWDQVRSRLVNSGCVEMSASPSPDGTVTQIPDGPRVGAWIMPDNRVPGMLENFLSFLVPAQDQLLPRVDGFFSSIPADIRWCPETRRPKARIHAWLALQDEPGKPLGQAITAKYLDAHKQDVEPFLRWIRRVLVD